MSGGEKIPLRLGSKIRLRPGLRFMLTLIARKQFWQRPPKCTGLAMLSPLQIYFGLLLQRIHSTFFFFSFFSFRATPVAYRSSQARGLFGAAAPSYATATAKQDSSHVCDLHCSSQQRQILKTLSGARDGTLALMDTSRVRFH